MTATRILPPANLAERVARTNPVIARYRDRAFDWRTGATCVHLLRAQLIAMGHRAPPVPPFRSALGARRSLELRGFATLTELIDNLLPQRRIAPAAMRVGDIAAVLGDEVELEAILIAAGGGEFMGWHGTALSGLRSISFAKVELGGVNSWRLG